MIMLNTIEALNFYTECKVLYLWYLLVQTNNISRAHYPHMALRKNDRTVS